MLSVFSVRADHTCQSLDGSNLEALIESHPRFFRNVEMAASWKAPKLYIADKKKEESSFVHFMAGTLAMNSVTYLAYKNILLKYGELLPANVKGYKEQFYLYNVLNVVDALDHERCIRSDLGGGMVGQILEYYFTEEKLVTPMIFKVPESPLIFISVNDNRNGADFFNQYHSREDTGLELQLIWKSN